mmetsp:Transcript_36254/g.56806  ORF Transcript_36254/g.56806 Transcript_36254/m.56806 type:complete len:136 (+) Transcript_36254:841-1248(+)
MMGKEEAMEIREQEDNVHVKEIISDIQIILNSAPKQCLKKEDSVLEKALKKAELAIRKWYKKGDNNNENENKLMAVIEKKKKKQLMIDVKELLDSLPRSSVEMRVVAFDLQSFFIILGVLFLLTGTRNIQKNEMK